MELILIFVVVSGLVGWAVYHVLNRRLPPMEMTLDKPERDQVLTTYGYDYRTKAYKAWMSPMIDIPSTQERMDAYFVAERIAALDYTCLSEAREAEFKLASTLIRQGWKVRLIDAPEFLKHYPYWMREAGFHVKNRSEIQDQMFSTSIDPVTGREFRGRLRRDLSQKVKYRERQVAEKERKVAEEKEFEETMRPLPNWTRKNRQ